MRNELCAESDFSIALIVMSFSFNSKYCSSSKFVVKTFSALFSRFRSVSEYSHSPLKIFLRKCMNVGLPRRQNNIFRPVFQGSPNICKTSLFAYLSI